jgi:hypothetical protein
MALVLGSGCAHEAKLIRPVSTTDYATFASAPLAVGGMTSVVGSRVSRDENRDAQSTMFENMMISERGDLVVVPAGRVRSLLGDESHATMLDEFESRGELNSGFLTLAGNVLAGQARFLILGRIEESSVSRDESGSDSKTLKTTLTVRAGFHVYDLEARQVVWSGDIENSTTNELTLSPNSSDDSSGDSGNSGFLAFLGGLLGSIFGGDDEVEYPPPPDVSEALPGIFDRLGEGLPQPPPKKH